MKLSIIGAGYVGLPLAIAFSKFFNVYCFDVNLKRIKELQSGNDLNNQHNKNEIKKKKFNFFRGFCYFRKFRYFYHYCSNSNK